MSVTSIEFLLGFLFLSSFFFLLPGPGWRKLVFSLCNAAFFALCVPNVATVVVFGLFTLSGYAVGRLLQLRPRNWLLAMYLTLLVAAFLVIKKYDFLYLILPAWVLAHPLGVVGLSYMLFRQIHFLVDVAQGQIKEFSLASFLNYQFNLFGFLSGPIQRYQEFHTRWHDMQPMLRTRHDILKAYLRLLIGYVEVCLISTYFLAKFDLWRGHLASGSIDFNALTRMQAIKGFAMVFYSYPLFLYFNFSGFCDIVIAGAALLGIALPENFDRPYLSRNLIDYWTRFHRSLGFWIRDYLFTPMYMAAATRWSRYAWLLAYPCYLAAFFLAGVWHGSTVNFAIFGVLHGIGASSVKAWENLLIKWIGRKGLKTYNASTPIRVASTVLTLHFAAFTYLFLPTDLKVTEAVIRHTLACVLKR